MGVLRLYQKPLYISYVLGGCVFGIEILPRLASEKKFNVKIEEVVLTSDIFESHEI